jgi:hypothetical protein
MPPHVPRFIGKLPLILEGIVSQAYKKVNARGVKSVKVEGPCADEGMPAAQFTVL